MIKKIKTLLLNKKNRIFLILTVIIALLILLKLTQKEAAIPQLPPEISPTPTGVIYPPITPTTFLLEEKGDPDFVKEVGRDLSRQYPLFNYLPYKTNNFSIGYSDSLTLIIILKTDTLEIRQEVLDWISSKGVDPQSHTLIWKIK